MGKHDRFADKLKRKPAPKDVKWRELKGFLSSLGFEELQGDGSRVKFLLRDVPDGAGKLILFFHNPHPSSDVKPRYIEKAVITLKERGLL
jgi:hypothetical protein